jgi:hypothetical protein
MKHTPIHSILLAALLPIAAWGKDAATIKAPLHGTGLPAATGVALAVLSASRSQLIVQAQHLDASHQYAVEIAGIVEGSVTSDRSGRARILFMTPTPKKVAALDFDPRGATLRLLDGTSPVLEGVISGTGEDRGSVVIETAELEPGDDAPSKAHGSARFITNASGQRSFQLDLSGLDDSPLHLLVDGVERGEIHRRGKTGRAVFQTGTPGATATLLDFDPRRSSVDIVSDGGTVFSGRMEAQVPRVNLAKPSVSRVALPATSAAGSGSASARLRIDERARKHFSVEVEGVPAGSYDLFVDGTLAGSITVAATKGEIEFTTDDDPTELALTFDPTGKVLSIRVGATVWFEGLFDPNTTGAGAPPPEPVSRFEEMLTSTGLDPDATARARYRVDAQQRHKFSVEIEKLPAGRYTLTVAGVVRGSILAQANVTTGAVVGEIEFATRKPRSAAREAESGRGSGGNSGGGGADDPAGDDHGDDAIDGTELLLNFDPRGQTIEISSASGIFFSHLLGMGSAGAVGTPVATFEKAVALMSTGSLPGATAGAKLRQRADGSRRFEVEIEHAPAGGVFDLLVDGTVRGSITVTATADGTRGELEFETSSDDGEPVLNFEVVGKEIVIQQAGVVAFSRLFPTP